MFSFGKPIVDDIDDDDVLKPISNFIHDDIDDSDVIEPPQ